MFVIVTKDTIFQSTSKISAKDIKPGMMLLSMKYNKKNKTCNVANLCKVSDVKNVKCDILQFDKFGVYILSKTLNKQLAFRRIKNRYISKLMYGKPLPIKRKYEVKKNVECVQIKMEDINAIPYIFNEMFIAFVEEPLVIDTNKKEVTKPKNETIEIEKPIETENKEDKKVEQDIKKDKENVKEEKKDDIEPEKQKTETKKSRRKSNKK